MRYKDACQRPSSEDEDDVSSDIVSGPSPFLCNTMKVSFSTYKTIDNRGV